MAEKRSLVRGGITLAVLAALAGAMVMAPAGAHVTGKFAHLKKHMRQVATKVFNQKIGSASVANATNADKLDNIDSTGFVQTGQDGIFASFKNGPIAVPSVLAPIASLSVPPGKYAVFAKAWIQDSADNFDVGTFCRLTAGATTDETFVEADNPTDNTGRGRGTAALELVHEFAAAGTITLACDDGVSGSLFDEARFIKIIAMRAASLANAASPRLAPNSPEARD